MDFLAHRFGANGFIGEHLWLWHLGHFLLLLSFCAALLSAVAYSFSEFTKEQAAKLSWLKLGRVSFITHGVSVFSIFVLLFIMILNHWFEYHYAWRHSSTDMPLKYIISSFWEGQEGSFLLWQFWLVVLGLIAMKTAKDYESPVLGMTAITQTFLGSMVLGVYILGHKIGSNPFILLRNEMTDAPIFQRPEYLKFIADGNGLNPLLQNYWMTIHPPVLFCGFASVLFPFAFIIGSLIRKDYNGWVKPALPWALFSVAILGTGILMGGAWAYESLSFGGFWAWDPVENMSLVPWLFVVAGLHLHVVYKYTKHGLFTTFLFYILGFVMVLYSTFLTRSGILGDTSVHAFTDLGMTGQLLIYLGIFLVPSLVLLFVRWRGIPSPEKEEELLSREFWMFIGSLVLMLSALQMIFTTSIPVWNILFFDWLHLLKSKLAPPEDVILHYNSIQIFLAIMIATGTAKIQFLAYKSSKLPTTFKPALYAALAAVLFTVGIAYGTHISFLQSYSVKGTQFQFVSTYYLLLLSAVYAAVSNLTYLFWVMKGNVKLSGGSIAHFGLGLFLVGVVISQYKKEVISINTQGENFGKEFNAKETAENILLLKDSVYKMGDFEVTYKGAKHTPPHHLHQVDYVKKDFKTGQVIEQFSLFPDLQKDEKRRQVSPNPDTKHYFSKDVFTHITAAPDEAQQKDSLTTHEVAVGDTFYNLNTYTVFTSITSQPTLPGDFDIEGKLMVGINLMTRTLASNEAAAAQPVYIIDTKNGNSVSTIPVHNPKLLMDFDVLKIDPQTKKVTVMVREKQKHTEYIIMKAIVFPFINLVWIGGIITFMGCLISMIRRIREI
jgi:cytochrome c-type biogenesis protein CcmF